LMTTLTFTSAVEAPWGQATLRRTSWGQAMLRRRPQTSTSAEENPVPKAPCGKEKPRQKRPCASTSAEERPQKKARRGEEMLKESSHKPDRPAAATIDATERTNKRTSPFGQHLLRPMKRAKLEKKTEYSAEWVRDAKSPRQLLLDERGNLAKLKKKTNQEEEKPEVARKSPRLSLDERGNLKDVQPSWIASQQRIVAEAKADAQVKSLRKTPPPSRSRSPSPRRPDEKVTFDTVNGGKIVMDGLTLEAFQKELQEMLQKLHARQEKHTITKENMMDKNPHIKFERTQQQPIDMGNNNSEAEWEKKMSGGGWELKYPM